MPLGSRKLGGYKQKLNAGTGRGAGITIAVTETVNDSNVVFDITSNLVEGATIWFETTGNVTNSDLLLTTLEQRETLGSTGIGKGVAIPHCRTMSVSEIHMIVGISEKGVDYDAPDNEKVNLFFLILAPPQEETNNYLPILGKICEMARDKKLREKMIKASDHETFVQLIREGR